MRVIGNGLRIVVVGLAFVLTAPQSVIANEAAMVIHGDVLVGVDDLGRVLVAVDKQPVDGFVDHCFVFTAEQRLEHPWSQRLENARVVHKSDSLLIKSTPPFFVVSLAISGSRPRHVGKLPHGSVFVQHNGLELGILNAGPGGGALLSSMVVEDLSTWPEPLWYDLLDPESGRCVDSDCESGGLFEDYCKKTIGQITCSVSCNSDHFACCKESPLGGQPMCRCRLCILGP